MDPAARHDPLPAVLHDVAALLIVRHLERHRPEVVVRCLFDSYQLLGGGHTPTDHRVRAAERLAERRLTATATAAGTTAPAPRHHPATSQAWRPNQSSIAL
jgi:hypothetical protein